MQSRKKILIVDDTESIRDLNERILGRNYVTASAADGEKALAALQTFRPDLVLLDVNMPVMDGLETCKRIRSNPAFRFTKIIFVSGMVCLPDRLAGYEAGGDDYIIKPCDSQELLAKVQILLRLKNEEELHDLKTDFINLMSHELRTPMNGILGFSDLLKDKLTGEAKEMADHILQSGRYLYTTLEKILLLTEVKSRELTEKKKSILAERLWALINRLENSKTLTFKLDGDCDVLIAADWHFMDKAFSYLLENAIKFSPQGGQITLETTLHDNECRIRISDQGAGIPPGRVEQIFDEFAIRDISHHHHGFGISLAIVKKIVELHGGRICATNAPLAGAVFTVILPHQPSESVEDKNGAFGIGSDERIIGNKSYRVVPHPLQ